MLADDQARPSPNLLCAGHYEAAEGAALRATAMGVAGAAVEHAKLLWAMDKAHRAITNLNAVWCLLRLHASSQPGVLNDSRDLDFLSIMMQLAQRSWHQDATPTDACHS